MDSREHAATHPPLPADRAAREGVIRDLYALATFLTVHGDHPLPQAVCVYHVVDGRGQLRALATQLGATVYASGRQFHHDLPDTRRVKITAVFALPMGAP